MIVVDVLDRFLSQVKGQALREGTRYAREARVGDFVGSPESVSTVVRGHTGEFEVALWVEGGELQNRCTCPSWRTPCKHELAAALTYRQVLAGAARAEAVGRPQKPAPSVGRPAATQDGASARLRALEERRLAARREKLLVQPDAPPFLRVESPSGYSYRVHLRGEANGPHSCECPDFEANRLHTCKHVERVRAWLGSPQGRLTLEHRREARRPRIYLHFGEVVEPRFFGLPRGPEASIMRRAFDEEGVPYRPLATNEAELHRWLGRFGNRVEPLALDWLVRRAERRPVLPQGDLAGMLPALGLKPYPYQWTGATFLARTGRALLADEMGLGKTVQAILAAAALRRASLPARSVTIVCPASLRGGWAEEIHRCLGEDAVLLEGATEARAGTIATRPAWLVTHYEQVLRDHRAHEQRPPDLLIIDEAQRAKGLWTRTARVLKAIRARYVFALTGTPLENRLEEAYAIAQLIDQRLLPPLWQLDRDHFVRDEKGRRVVLYQGLGTLRSRLAPAFLRRRKEDVALDLPERVRSTAMLPMHEAVVSTYEDVLAQVARIASKKVLLPADLERIQRLLVIARRCCNGPHMLGQEVEDRKVPKLEELEQALRDLCLGEGRKAVVFSEWTDMTDRAEAQCRRLRLPVFHLHGGVSVRSRPALLRAFTDHKGPAVFVSTDAGGVGLNLQVADVVINLDLPWNPARLEQRVARVHRIGSKGTVHELLFVTKESIEERILRLHGTKRDVLANIWDKGDQDVIAAPGGSGAFREMVAALLRTQGPLGAVAGTAPDGPAEASPAAGAGADRDGGLGAGMQPTSGHAVLAAGALASSDGPADVGAVAVADALIAAGSGTAPLSTAAGGVIAPGGVGAPGTSATAIDPTVLSSVIAAIAPTIAPEHRKSLAAVLHALAGALEAP